MTRVQVAYTLEQCWHPVPGGSAVAALRVAEALRRHGEVELIGVAGRHRRPPQPPFRPTVPMRWLPVARPVLYETWNRFGWPKVEAVTGLVDVCHSTVAIPAATEMASVVTVHDLAFVHTPDRFSKHGARVMLAGLERCRAVDVVCCPSQQTHDDLAEYGFDPERIRVIGWGVDAAPATADEIAAARTEYRLPAEFALFVGTIEPRKNLSRLVAAMAEIDLPLVVAGAQGWGDDVDLADQTVATSNVPDHNVTSRNVRASNAVRFLGFVPEPRLAGLYAAASVFVYPSLEEGFGLPVLEAMAQGTPVVTSATTATAEAAGGAAVLIDPTDTESISDGIIAALAEPDRLADAGRGRVAGATWESVAALTLDAYRLAVERHQAGAGTRSGDQR